MTPRQPAKTKTTKAPAKARRAPSQARSTGKGARKPRAAYDEATRATAVAQLEAEGMAATASSTGIPKATLSRWAKAAGVDLGEQARARTATATEAVRARAAEVSASTVELLEHHIAQAGEYLSTVAGVNALAAQLIAKGNPEDLTVAVGMAGPYVTIKDGTDAAELGKVALALAGLPLAVRDAEGILTRAVHDLQLLKGEATERGELVVEFNVPRPTPGDTPVVEQPRSLEEGTTP